jgi:Truncated hemoglobins
MLTRHLLKSTLYVCLALAVVFLFNVNPRVAQEEKAEEKVEKSLYERLGGYDAVAAVIDDFFKRMINDPQLGKFFIGLSTDSKKRAQQLTVDFVCKATGGPCLYTGRDMKTTHEGVGINESDWELAAKYLTATLDKFNVPEQEKNEVLTLVSSLKGVIVEK